MPAVDPIIYNYTFDVMRVLPSFQTLEDEDRNDPLTMFYGIELEVQPSQASIQASAGTRSDSSDIALSHMYEDLDGFAIAKADSTIGEEGFEIVTVPATKLKHEQEWAKFFDRQGRKATKSWPSHTCGMHVHIGRDKFSPLVLGKMLMFYNQPSNKEFIFKLSGRRESELNDWARLNPQTTLVHGLHGHVPGAPRASAVNITKKGTIEIRIFRGNVQPEGFLKNLEAVQAIFRFCCDTPARDIKYQNFCDWLQDQKHSSEYQHLIDWAKAKELIGTSPGKKGRLLRTYAEGE